MTVLVTYATKHGSTREIAEAIATTLVDRAIPTDALAVNTIADVELYEAVVLGSAVYMGRWLNEATEFARRHREQLIARPLWVVQQRSARDGRPGRRGTAEGAR
jgi:menaquinone-dependent protoporphyrinogen oxidase